MVAELRRHPGMQETPILLLSAKADDELKDAAAGGGRAGLRDQALRRARPAGARAQPHRRPASREALREAEIARRESVEAANRELQARSGQLGELFEQAPGFMAVLRGTDHVFELANRPISGWWAGATSWASPCARRCPRSRSRASSSCSTACWPPASPTSETRCRSCCDASRATRPNSATSTSSSSRCPARMAQFSGVFVEGNDVTDRKRAEEALRAADRRKDEFLATLAHELRNPLAPIRHAAAHQPDAAGRPRRRSSGRTRSSSARSSTWRGCSTTCWTSRASRAASSSCARSGSTLAEQPRGGGGDGAGR